MAEIKENTIGVIERFALLCNGIEEIYPNGKGVLVYELNKDDFGAAKGVFNVDDLITKKFKIDISGVEIIFILDELLNVEINNSSEILSE